MKICIGVLILTIAGCASKPSNTDHASGPGKKIVVHGHRGSRGTHLENSLPAFKEAVEAGADVLEMDLHLSADNVLLVTHDCILDKKVCKIPMVGRGKKRHIKTIRVRQNLAADIQKFDCGSIQHSRFPEQKTSPGMGIPRFEEVLDWIKKEAPNVGLNVEAKMDEPRAADNPDPKMFAQKIIGHLSDFGLLDRAIIQSFDFRVLEEARKLNSKIRLAALIEREKGFCDMAANSGANIASPDFSLVNADRVRVCHEKGIEVVPWTVNSEAEWTKLIRYGVDGIITDYPRKLVEFLKGQGK
jgi:glycerophosphoryl diester phosphodiesterase